MKGYRHTYRQPLLAVCLRMRQNKRGKRWGEGTSYDYWQSRQQGFIDEENYAILKKDNYMSSNTSLFR
jgi:hypothetical protein